MSDAGFRPQISARAHNHRRAQVVTVLRIRVVGTPATGAGSELSDPLPRLAPMLAPHRQAAWPAEAGIAAAALVETAQGPRPAGALRPGTLLRAASGELRLLRRLVPLAPAQAGDVVTIAASAIAEGVPARPLGVRRGQPLLLDGAVWPAGFLEDGVAVIAGPAGLSCVGLETDAPCAVLVEGLACPSHKPPGRPVPDASLATLRAAIGVRAGRHYGRLEGVAEHLRPDGAEGWVRDGAMHGVPVLVALLRDGVPVGHGFANLARPDLAMAGFGACAFRIEAASPLAGAQLLELRRAEDGTALPAGASLLLPMPGDPDVPATPEAVAGALADLTRARLRRGPSTPR